MTIYSWYYMDVIESKVIASGDGKSEKEAKTQMQQWVPWDEHPDCVVKNYKNGTHIQVHYYHCKEAAEKNGRLPDAVIAWREKVQK